MRDNLKPPAPIVDIVPLRTPKPLMRDGQLPTLYTYSDGRVCAHPDGEMHNCAYVQARNRLIPQAERIAREAVGSDDPNGMRFSRAFMAAMDMLFERRAHATGERKRG